MMKILRILGLFRSAATVDSFIARKMSQTTVHPIAESGFSTSQLYDLSRPSYSKEAVTFLLEKLDILPRNLLSDQPTRVLELGTGTGKFTRTLKEVLRGSNVQIIASEPVLSMRQEFIENFPDIEIKEFSAENIDLPDASVQSVIAAQCFHWFANNKAISEIQRVLVPGGRLGLIWNYWDHSMPWVKDVDEQIILPLYWETNTPIEITGEWKKVLDSSATFGPIEGDESFKSEQQFTCDELIDRVMSISVVQIKNENEKEMVKEKVRLVLKKHNELEKSKIILPYIVKMYWAERK